jgi:hypothetical protein
VESGKHEELLKLSGQYKRLYEMQFRDVPHISPRSGTLRRWWSRRRADEQEPLTESG